MKVDMEGKEEGIRTLETKQRAQLGKVEEPAGKFIDGNRK